MRHASILLVTACHAASPPGPGVLLVTLDTTRADHLGCYGYPDATTPTLDALAAAGARFERAISSCPLTIPSHSTIMTGLFPPEHGVRDNGDFVLGDEAITLAERFHDAGWSTAAFTAAFPTHHRWGFGQGFDVYHDPLPRDVAVQDWRDQRTAREVVDDALLTLPQLRGPAFVWVHLFDAHWPYEPPPAQAALHPGRPYDGEIAFADEQLGLLVASFRQRWPEGIVAVTADHGEGLGDGGEPTHGFLLHDATLHVPLILAGRGVPAATVIDGPVSHVDLAPTLLRLAGLPLHPGMHGRDLFDGGTPEVWSEARTGMYQLGLAPLHALTVAEGRFVEGAWPGWYAFRGRYDLVPAPGADLASWSAHLADVAGRMGVASAPPADLPPEDRRMLEAMGYLATGDIQAIPGHVDPRDVIDLIPLTWQARQLLAAGRVAQARALQDQLQARMPGAFGVRQLSAQILQAEGRPEEAIGALQALYAASPSSTLAQQIGDLALALGDPREAESWYVAALQQLDISPRAMSGLVRCALALGEPERARELADRFLAVFPDHAELHTVLGELALSDGRPAEALAQADLALDRAPFSAWALSLSARATWALGRPDRAIDRLQHLLTLEPTQADVRLLLGTWLLEVGRAAEAVRTLRPLARLLPEDPTVAAALDRAQAALDDQR